MDLDMWTHTARHVHKFLHDLYEYIILRGKCIVCMLFLSLESFLALYNILLHISNNQTMW